MQSVGVRNSLSGFILPKNVSTPRRSTLSQTTLIYEHK
jgi:hypothetical protein